MTVPNIQSTTVLDRDSLIPLYHQLYEILRANIDDGIWQPGDMISPESELQQQYGVSQITVRKALNILVDQGLIFRRRGLGSFVAQPVITSNLTHIVTFAEDMRLRSHAFRTEMIETVLSPVSKATAEKLRVTVGEEIAAIMRLRYADDEPLSIEHSCLLHKYVPGILQYDFTQRSLSETLSSEYGLFWSRAEQTIRAQRVSSRYAKLLGMHEDDPLLVVERISYSQDNVPIEFLRISYRADRYALHCDLKGSIG
jgi:GntR family transcriptional regulator